MLPIGKEQGTEVGVLGTSTVAVSFAGPCFACDNRNTFSASSKHTQHRESPQCYAVLGYTLGLQPGYSFSVTE